MNKRRIQILSTGEVNNDVIDLAVHSSIDMDVIPFIRTEALKTDLIKEQIEKLSSERCNVIFTSANAVRAVGSMASLISGWKIYCLQNSTLQEVRRVFGDVQVAGTSSDAKGLAHILIKERPEGKMVFFCGDMRREELPRLLRENEFVLVEKIVYKTVLIPEKLNKKYDGIIFYSPSAVKSFLSLNKFTINAIVFALGESTAQELKKSHGLRIVVSEEPSKMKLIQELITFFNNSNSRE